MLNGLYTFEKIYARVRGVFTNTVPIDAYRGAGRPEAAFIVERMVDHAARTLGVDPADLRRKNFIPPDAMPYQTATGLTYDSGDFARKPRRGAGDRRRGRLSGPARGGQGARQAARPRHRDLCRGLRPADRPRRPTIQIDGTGKVTVLIGTQTNGQGHETAYKQVVAEHLGVDPDGIEVVQGDTRPDRHRRRHRRLAVDPGRRPGGRRGGAQGAGKGPAPPRRGDGWRPRPPTWCSRMAGSRSSAPTARSLCRRSRGISAATAHSTRPATSSRRQLPSRTGRTSSSWKSTQLPGVVSFDRYTVVDDFGKVLNPLMVAGQVHGGVAQGIGQALLEHTRL